MIKRYTYLFTACALLSLNAFAQEFSTRLVFSNPIGQSDTLIVGTDNKASMGIDPEFNEINIKASSFNAFEVRAANYNWCTAFPEPGILISDPSQFNTKKIINPPHCEGYSWNQFPFVIYIRNAEWPISIDWIQEDFSNPCHAHSLITDWQPNGWWDAVWGPEHMLSTSLPDSSHTSYDYTTHSCLSEQGDTLHMLFMIMTHPGAFTLGIEAHQMAPAPLQLYPNPAHNHIVIDIAESNKQKPATLRIFDFIGRQVHQQNTKPGAKNCSIQVHDWPAGMYSVQMISQNSLIGLGRFLVK